jgi:hypothetical protein
MIASTFQPGAKITFSYEICCATTNYADYVDYSSNLDNALVSRVAPAHAVALGQKYCASERRLDPKLAQFNDALAMPGTWYECGHRVIEL